MLTPNHKGSVSRRWRTIALLALGVALGTTVTAPPVYSHVGGTVAHLWTKHIRPQADKRYPTKAAAEARYVNVGEKASDAELFDGLDSNIFVTGNTSAGGDLTGSYPSPVVGPNAIRSAEVQPNSLTGGDFGGDSIGGAQIVESSLGQVPSAANAASVDGQSATTFGLNVDTGLLPNVYGRYTFFRFGGLTLKADCYVDTNNAPTHHIRFFAFTDADDSYIRSNIDGVHANADWDIGETLHPDASLGYWFASNVEKAGTIVYRRGPAAGDQTRMISVTIAWATLVEGQDCQIAGTVIGN